MYHVHVILWNNAAMWTWLWTQVERYPRRVLMEYYWANVDRMSMSNGTFGCMISISSSLGNLFYIWLLLKYTTGPTSFEDLHTFDKELYHDFNGACIDLGLCKDDSRGMEAMVEAVQISHPFVIGELFYNILLHCNPSDSREIFHHYSIVWKKILSNVDQCF